MKKPVLLIALFLVGVAINAQTTGQVANYNVNGDGGVTDALYRYALGSIDDANKKTTVYDESIEGSPYASNAFLPTAVYYGDELAGQVFYRYNAHNQEIEIKQQNLENEPIRSLGRDKKINIRFNGKPMSFKTFIDKTGKTQNGYLTLVRDGKYKLYKRLNIKFKEAKKAPNSFVKGSPARFTSFTEYYLESEDGKRIDELELNTKKLLNLVSSEKQQSVKKFMKENKIRLSNEQDVQSVIDFLNS